MRKGKGMQMEIEGEGVFEDLGRKIKRSFEKTFNPRLGEKIKDAFTSKPAREVYKGLANVGLKIGSSFTGLPLGLAEGEIDRQIDGASIKRRYKKKNLMVEGGTLVAGVPSVMRMGNNPMIRHGGVMTKVGKGFTSSKGTHYGGSFASPTSGGSFASA
jgi:ribosomal protein S6E (S10)